MPYILKTICCICKELLSVQSLPNKPLMDTSHGMCPTCAKAWEEEQLAEVAPLLEKMKAQDEPVLEIYDDELDEWVSLDLYKRDVPLPGDHIIGDIIDIYI